MASNSQTIPVGGVKSTVERSAPCSTDWSKCVICQEDNPNDTLQCSALKSGGSGYKTLADNLIHFSKLGSLPFNIERLNEGAGVEATLNENCAKVHKLCRLNYGKSRLQRELKRKSIEKDNEKNKFARFTRHSHTQGVKFKEEKCFFCGEKGKSNPLHKVSTFPLDKRVRKCALQLQDSALLAKLSAGDLVAQEAQYHAPCLVSLYKKAAQSRIQNDDGTEGDKTSHGIALAELVMYIEEVRFGDNAKPKPFLLSDLAKMYQDRISQLGVLTDTRVHTTRLKERILAYFPDMEAHKKGKEVFLIFEEDCGRAISQAFEEDGDDEGFYLVKAARILRNEMLNMTSKFTGSFTEGCQESSVPKALPIFINMMLEGPNIKPNVTTQAAMTLAQLMQFNCHTRRRKDSVGMHHSLDRETPLPVYIGLDLHAQTRKRKLVDKMFELGLSISYDRVLSISSEIANKVCYQYKADNVVCPQKLRGELFTTGAVDNIDHNTSSTTAKDSFHGTGISLFQHPTQNNRGVDRGILDIGDLPHSKTITPLPESYSSIPPLVLWKKYPPMPEMAQNPTEVSDEMALASPDILQAEHSWLNHVAEVTSHESIPEDENVSWAAYNAKNEKDPDFLPSISSLLPLFSEDSKSVAMIRHSMDVIKAAVQHVNPGQVPVITFDQPLYTLAKEIQWTWPEQYGEEKFVIILGGFHTEMTMLKCLGDWLQDSGWTDAITQAQITSPGVADSLLKASHVPRARHVHEVSASSLHILLKRAYAKYHGGVPKENTLSFDDWISSRMEESPQFQYWYITLQLELLLLAYVRSIREGNFLLYNNSLTKLVPWLFALDHTHYARWLPVHIHDMSVLNQKHPDVYHQFLNGKFVVHKTQNKFSAMAIDQAHEQNNALIKDDGGAVGLLESPSALLRWMVAGPEVARLVTEFEQSSKIRQDISMSKHHQQSKSFQTSFFKEVKSLVNVLEEMGSPFTEKTGDLLTLDTKDIADPAVIKTVREIAELGQEQYETFVNERLKSREMSVFDTIKRNQLPLFRNPRSQEVSHSKFQVNALKMDCSLFSKLYIACQVRDGNLDTFFQHENQTIPPALSQFGQIRQGTKSDLIDILEQLYKDASDAAALEPPAVDSLIIDGAAIVNMLKPGSAKTFEDYAEQVFIPYIMNQLRHVKRIDIVWDQYFPKSLKSTTRQKRGKGVRRRVTSGNKIPGNWPEFLRVDENKTELFSFLASYIVQHPGIQALQKDVYTTQGNTIVTTSDELDTALLSPCTHEEADTRIFLHALHASNTGYKKLTVRTVDTDVVVLAISLFNTLSLIELWVAFGHGKNYRYIAVHEIVKILGVEKAKALLMFHSFTGCDTTSSFTGKGKKSAWEVWKVYEEATRVFLALSSPAQSIEDDHLAILERFVVLLYDRTSGDVHVDVCRKHLFTSKGRAIESIPPTQGALLQHIKRAAYQAGHIWGQSLIPEPEIVSPSDWGWHTSSSGGWQPLWSLLPEASRTCQELLKCGCKKGCQRNCKCKKAMLKCTALCKCHGECHLP